MKKSGEWGTHRGDRGAQSGRWYKKNKEKSLAHQKVYFAIKNGLIKRPSVCEMCKREGRVLAHHKDYKKALDVLFVCQKCHNEIHGITRNGGEMNEESQRR